MDPHPASDPSSPSSTPDSTWWSMVRGAGAGDALARAAFARRYLPAVRAYLSARWRGGILAQDVEDATQEVFVECFRDGGALARVDSARPGGFRPFLYGVVRNVARRAEERAGRPVIVPPERPAVDEESASRAFDRRWAQGVMKEAGERMLRRAAGEGDASLRRVDLLRLRFQDGLAVREVSARWGVDAAWLHHEYAKARAEFRTALRSVVAEHLPGPDGEIDAECARLLAALR
jgi:RNA polymerase sigma-70 factor (ECF subfamily)